MKRRLTLTLLACISAAIGTAILLPSCGCTLIACFDGLTLEMKSSDGGEIVNFSGTASYDGGVVSFSCPRYPVESGYLCQGSEVLLTNVYWPKVKVQVDANDGGIRGSAEIEPRYTSSQPNGPFCGPACKGAVHQIQLSQ